MQSPPPQGELRIQFITAADSQSTYIQLTAHLNKKEKRLRQSEFVLFDIQKKVFFLFFSSQARPTDIYFWFLE